MQRSISVFGLGYVGTVTAACLAHQGNWVLGTDPNTVKVKALGSGRSPILEPGLSEMIAQTSQAGSLHATSDGEAAVRKTEISLICVGTPGFADGRPDLRHVESVCRQIGTALKSETSFHLVVVRSTVLPGTTETLLVPILEEASGKKLGQDFGMCVNPEFMREGSALADFLAPPVTVIGEAEAAHGAMLRDLYDWAPGRIVQTTFRTAEMTKYLFNSWHALKVAFANEMGSIATRAEVDIEEMLEIFSADTKLNISTAYMKPGFAFGGSCLPKDLRALNFRAKELDLKLPLCGSILQSNAEHFERAVHTILETGKKKAAVLGLSFKPGTDDLRESPQVQLVKRLLQEGIDIRVWDCNVRFNELIGANRQYIEQMIPQIESLLCANLPQATDHAELIIVACEGLNRDSFQQLLRPHHQVIDLADIEKSIPSTLASGV